MSVVMDFFFRTLHDLEGKKAAARNFEKTGGSYL
jgi:hypothetical protein